MLTEKDYCDLDTSHELWIMGLEPETYYDGPHILLYEAQKWLREEKEVYVSVIPEYNEYCPVKGIVYRLEIAYWKDDEFGYETVEWLDEEESCVVHRFESYEQALAEGIKKAINILKENDKRRKNQDATCFYVGNNIKCYHYDGK